MQKNIIALACLTLLISNAVIAHPFAKIASPDNFYVGIGDGISALHLQKTNEQINYYNGLLTDAYPTNNNTPLSNQLFLQGGMTFLGANKIPSLSLGLGLYTTEPTNYSVSGQTIETALGDAPFSLYNYHYNVSSKRLMAEAKLSWALKSHFNVFIDLGAGTAWTQLSDYTEKVSNPSGYVTLPGFANKSKRNFAYQAGLGLGYHFNISGNSTHFEDNIALGYRHVSLGSLDFGTRGNEYPYKLPVGRLTTNDVYLVLTHEF